MKTIMRFYSPSDSYSKIKYFPKLFFRDDFYYTHQTITFRSHISFNTYVNLIPVSRYKRYTRLKNLIVRITLLSSKKTTVHAKVIGVDNEGIEYLLINQFLNLENDEKYIWDLNIDLINIPENLAYLYLWLGAPNARNEINILLNESGVFTKDEYEEIKLAIVTPTFKKEKYVLSNIEKMKKSGLLDSKNIYWLIIDNGRSLKNFISEEEAHPRIKIIENINSGGAGGFARGILEVFENMPDITHILFMDDDVDLEPFAIERAYDFISFTDGNVGIGGSMLSLFKPFIMWESSAIYKLDKKSPILVLNKHKINLIKDRNLAFLLKELPWTYYGWWFLVLPLSIYKNTGLPFPFFFRADDMEYGFRLVKNNIQIIDLPSVFVLHEDFFAKFNAFVDYLISRNELIMRCIHFDNLNSLLEFKYFIKKLLKLLFSYRYETAQYVVKGYEDFLRGPDFIANMDTQNYHQTLAKEVQKEKTQNINKNLIKSFLIKHDNQKKAALLRWLHFITLGSHIIPPFKAKNISEEQLIVDQDYIIEPLHSYRFYNLFRVSKVLYYNEEYNVGFFVEKNTKKFFKVLIKGLVVGLKLLLRYNKVKQAYRKKYNDMITPEFWKKYLNINSYKEKDER